MATPNNTNESKQNPNDISTIDSMTIEKLKKDTFFVEITFKKDEIPVEETHQFSQDAKTVEEQLAYVIANGTDIDWFPTNRAKEGVEVSIGSVTCWQVR